MCVEALHLKNYRVFRHILMKDIPALAVFVGAGGTGKPTLFDVLGFLRGALLHDVWWPGMRTER